MFLSLGSELTEFRWFRTKTETSTMGRVLRTQREDLGKISGVLAVANGEEKERWSQLSYPVSHKVIFRGKPKGVFAVGDVFQWKGAFGQRQLILSGIPYDVGNLGHYFLVYGDERRDLA